MAIEHGLIDIIQRHTTYNITFKPCSNWSNQNRVPTTNTFNTIRIISDSKTSLNWIAGSYRIKEKRIYDIVQRIGDTMCYINQHMDVDIRMQWTKAHVQTVGNELADGLAKEAVELINEQWMPYNTFNWTDKNIVNISHIVHILSKKSNHWISSYFVWIALLICFFCMEYLQDILRRFVLVDTIHCISL
eukprot:141635_1